MLFLTLLNIRLPSVGLTAPSGPAGAKGPALSQRLSLRIPFINKHIMVYKLNFQLSFYPLLYPF